MDVSSFVSFAQTQESNLDFINPHKHHTFTSFTDGVDSINSPGWYDVNLGGVEAERMKLGKTSWLFVSEGSRSGGNQWRRRQW